MNLENIENRLSEKNEMKNKSLILGIDTQKQTKSQCVNEVSDAVMRY